METTSHFPWYTKRKRVPLALRDARMVPKQAEVHGTAGAALDVSPSPQPAVGPLAETSAAQPAAEPPPAVLADEAKPATKPKRKRN